MSTRIDKYLANAGYCSRRKVEEFLKKHQVLINGKRINEHGQRFDSSKDSLKIDNQTVASQENVYYLVNKPVGYVSTVKDEHQRKTVLDLLPKAVTQRYRLYPVGRLDVDSSGLVLLTNDGDLAYKLTHPKFHIPKTYRLTINGKVKGGYLNLLRRGVKLKDGITAPAEVKKVSVDEKTTILEVTLYEGRNRQIRRMCKALNLELVSLQRLAIGSVTLDQVGEKSWKLIQKTSLLAR